MSLLFVVVVVVAMLIDTAHSVTDTTDAAAMLLLKRALNNLTSSVCGWQWDDTTDPCGECESIKMSLQPRLDHNII
jgi:hypothetical protein